MIARSPLVALSFVVFGALATSGAAQTLYRYVDANGRIVYSDQPPPPTVKDAQTRQLPENVIETDPVPLQARQAAERFPVTLYTFDCDVCRTAQALLVKRGIPFQTVIVSEEKGAAKLEALTGKHAAPVLTIGDKQVIQGYNEERWQAMLDEAGYPRTMPAVRREPLRTSARAKADTQPPAVPEETAPAGPGTGYPK